MKTIILNLALVASLTTNVFAQRGPAERGPAERGPAERYNTPTPAAQSKMVNRVDNAVDMYKIDMLDRIVNLSFQQEKELNRIENRYDKLIAKANKRPFGQNIQQLEWQKEQEIMAVLTPAQRQKLIAYQNNNRYGRQGGFGRHS